MAARLRLLLRLGGEPLLAAAGGFWRHPRLDRLFAGYLLELHGIVGVNFSLLSEAARLARLLREPGARVLGDYLARHAEEERGHDAWLRQDLAVVGISEPQVRSHTPCAAVSGLVGRQMYLMTHVHPVALLGYIAVLEGFPATVREIRETGRRAGLPAGSLRTMLKHARLDPGHRDDLDRLLGELPISAPREALVRASALATIDDLTDLFLGLTAALPERAAG